ncbi:glyoxalase/bleomycin resistance/dioxygenase family protein [Bacillus sp. AFS018417]|uniref:VOC family protein n=1 Tax=unclassified Bacillus (in: firmicutes) TaxID=185979 RepID=UPI000BF51CB5|nr:MULTISPECIES: VOC family protein [unclassified Bacillus (in: firmicutes)]MCP1123432.1 VOC family protein [Bacillus sp. 3103sda1]PEZ02929.1 glyoxalase/bleomycin resistance/dioxygenase family protein [Bacillus sp. AFS018417]
MSQPLLNGMEGVFIPVKDPKISAEWYEEKLGFKLIYIEREAAVMKIAEESQTVICLVRTVNQQPMKFPENNFGVGKYYNFISKDINEIYRLLIERGVKVNPISGEGATRFFTFFDPDGNPLGACQ